MKFLRYPGGKQKLLSFLVNYLPQNDNSLRATLAKLSAPIRNFFKFAKQGGVDVAMIGQEKSGAFFDHLQLIGKHVPVGTIFISDNTYIRNEVQHYNTTSTYGTDTNMNALYYRLNWQMVWRLCQPIRRQKH